MPRIWERLVGMPRRSIRHDSHGSRHREFVNTQRRPNRASSPEQHEQDRLHWIEQVSQVIHREVRAAANVVESLGRKIGSVSLKGDIPAIVRHQRWSPLNVPLFWAAASDSSCPVLEWIMAAASQSTKDRSIHVKQHRLVGLHCDKS